MAVDLDKEPDYNVLLQALIDKTKAGKLRWEETADEDTFVAAVKGQRTFEVSGKDAPQFVVAVRDEEGKVFFQTPASSMARELFLLARRVALHVDEKIDSTMVLLENL
ncbi:MAG: hypothetical protein A2V70_01795 [Planctomycetes bacterium RBG_13_63_9]|nr:MAG: hypothetical protein A2V70_01795 [Planctomycetes bacterium RBG_13_63_9]